MTFILSVQHVVDVTHIKRTVRIYWNWRSHGKNEQFVPFPQLHAAVFPQPSWSILVHVSIQSFSQSSESHFHCHFAYFGDNTEMLCIFLLSTTALPSYITLLHSSVPLSFLLFLLWGHFFSYALFCFSIRLWIFKVEDSNFQSKLFYSNYETLTMASMSF